ncbi:MAG TPA: 3-oxoacyl-ACP reductase [Acidobacteria bacterium]|nr:3-oxoacyl-ACP reductase [Acidobacteriota bacterium]
MRIESVKAAYPSRVVSNDDVLEMVSEHSEASLGDELGEALKRIKFYLHYSGSNTRNWLAEGERPIDFVATAVESALAQAGVAADEIDVVVYVGIGRGFLEPGGAYHVAAALGLTRAHCFDVIDACMSWTRAMQLVQSLFRGSEYRRALVVNAEFNMYRGGAIYPAVFKLPSVDAVEWTFPSFTLGEAATATVVEAEDDHPWRFEYSSRPDLADLCNIPIHGHEGYGVGSDRIARNGVGRFTSFGFDLHAEGNPEIIEVYRRLGVPREEIAAVYTHASSQREWSKMAEEVGIGDRVWHIYSKAGNVVSASVPAAIASSIEAGRVERGDRLVGWVGSAGMSFCAYSFIY